MGREAKLVSKLRETIDEMEGRHDRRITGWHMYLKHGIEELNKKYREMGRPLGLGEYQNIARICGRRWQALAFDVKSRFHMKALDFIRDKQDAREALKAELTQTLRAARARAAEEKAWEAKSPLTVNGCALNDAAWATWDAFFEQLKASRSTVLAEKRQRSLYCPPPLTVQEKKDMQLMPIIATHAKAPRKPAWLSLICQLREQIKGAVLKFKIDDDAELLVRILYLKNSHSSCTV